ncbi:MAG: ribbon-helix-helix protein, CopG family [Chloroflexi bacterium]|nr:ribbon-helix-helix protein, CopG family [Chloroflexota bacterium]
MKRTQIYLDDDHDAQVSKRAAAVGTTKSALIREAIDAYLAGPMAPAAGLARFRAAVDELERTSITFEDGAEYVERIRALDTKRQAELERRRR